MGLMKRVLLHHLANGTPLPKKILFNRAAFGMEDPKPVKKKKKDKAELPALPTEEVPDALTSALANAEKVLGRKVTMDELTGGKKHS